jgi:hypothetical protein
MMYLTNAFSLNMLPNTFKGELQVRPLSIDDVRNIVEACEELERPITGAIGHPDTAALVNGILGVEVAHSRVTVTLNRSDSAVIAQYRGPRLPEGATELPEGAEISFSLVTVLPFKR